MFREWEFARNTSSNAKYRWRCMKASLVLTLLVVACFVARLESASGVVVGLLWGGGGGLRAPPAGGEKKAGGGGRERREV